MKQPIQWLTFKEDDRIQVKNSIFGFESYHKTSGNILKISTLSYKPGGLALVKSSNKTLWWNWVSLLLISRKLQNK